ncbi:MAG: type II methionyl aminopeptidase [Candidatus Hydrothermarchaeota archaeon]
MNEEEILKYREAGKIASHVREITKDMVREGVKLLDIAEFVEREIIKLGGMPAFPCNISINEIAAHYSPPARDETILKHGDYVKIDIGVHKDGYIADTACTLKVGEKKDDLIKASEDALNNSIKEISPGKSVGEIGRVIEETIKDYGLKPIVDLTGHTMEKWNLHSGKTVPNVGVSSKVIINEGDVLAIEPFASTGGGRVADDERVFIFGFIKEKPIRLREARLIISEIKKKYKTLPFAERWLAKVIPQRKLEFALKQLIDIGSLHPYRVLKERDGGMVSQAEDTVIVTSEGCEVITR